MKDLWGNEYTDYEDLYTPSSFTPKKRSNGGWKSKYGSGGWSKSSWSNYSFVVSYEDNDDSLFVKDPVHYLTPTAVDIKKKVNVRKQDSIDMIKELARVCYFKMIDEKDYIADAFIEEDQQSDTQRGKKQLFDSIYDQYIPGFTPLEQAISIYLKLKDNSAGESGEKDEDDTEVDMKKGLDFDRTLYTDPSINEQLNLNEMSKERSMEILNLLSLVGEFGTEFKVEKEIDEKIVANSDQYLKTIMRSHDQLTMIDLYQRLLPNFDIKFLTKDLTVNVPVDRKEQKQKIIIILDFSGSMDDPEKQIWVNAILIDRFKYVMRGEAEVFFSYFVHDADDLEFQHIKNREDVISFWQTFSNEPDGGSTEVADMVERIASEINEHKLCNLDVDLFEEKPEILIINDGQDRINTKKFPYKVNAITLMEYNDDLKHLCLQTGGKLIQVNEDQSVYSHSKEAGKLQITKK
jgi:uncharacterized protein with von Willebrand factor type A (vWA) domain